MNRCLLLLTPRLIHDPAPSGQRVPSPLPADSTASAPETWFGWASGTEPRTDTRSRPNRMRNFKMLNMFPLRTGKNSEREIQFEDFRLGREGKRVLCELPQLLK